MRLHLFDGMHLGGEDLCPLPYLERRAALESLALEGPHWTTTPRFIGWASEVFAAVREMQLEGVVLKPVASSYRPGRRGAWAKHKATCLHDRVAVRAVPPTRTQPAGFLVARPDSDGCLFAHQIIRHGLGLQERGRLRRLLLRGRPVAVSVRAHGRPEGVLRDALLDSITA